MPAGSDGLTRERGSTPQAQTEPPLEPPSSRTRFRKFGVARADGRFAESNLIEARGLLEDESNASCQRVALCREAESRLERTRHE